MAEKLYRSRCRIHGYCGCEVCVDTDHGWKDRKRRSKRRRRRAAEELRKTA